MSELSVVRLDYGDTPPSMNSPASGFKSAHWRPGWEMKKHWQQIFEGLLMGSPLPRGCIRAEVTVTLSFPKRQRRDAENYLPLLSKSLGDALVNGRWIPDDTPEHYRMERVSFAVGPPSTMIEIAYDHESHHAAA